MVAIIDYDIGNLRSVQKAVLRLGCECIITRDPGELEKSDKLIIPGVGNFEKGMNNLSRLNLIENLSDLVIAGKKKILGICLGMQLMTEFSEEGNCEGIGWIGGRTKLFRIDTLKVPHIGWNTLTLHDGRLPHLEITPEDEFYFVHSYYAECTDKNDILFETEYGTWFTSGFLRDNIMGVQFHPEKSHKSGLKILKSFLDW